MCRLAAELEVQGPVFDGTDLLDALVTSVFLLDQDLHVNYLNAAGQTLLGLGANQALGRRFVDLARGGPTHRRALRASPRSPTSSKVTWYLL